MRAALQNDLNAERNGENSVALYLFNNGLSLMNIQLLYEYAIRYDMTAITTFLRFQNLHARGVLCKLDHSQLQQCVNCRTPFQGTRGAIESDDPPMPILIPDCSLSCT